MRAGVVALLALALSACAAPAVIRHTTTGTVPVTDTFVVPPPGGPSILAVVQRPYSNAVRQEIALTSNGRTPGQNGFSVTFYGTGDSAIGNALPNPPLLMTDISREMIERFPGVAMQVASAYVQNKYGPFGYAVGRAGRDELCFYGWQRIRAPDQSSTLFSGQGTISVRLRLCDRGADEETLLAVMYGYTIVASLDDPGWNPYGAPVGPDEGLGRPSAPTYPAAAGGFVPVLRAAPDTGRSGTSAAPVRRAPAAPSPADRRPATPPPVEGIIVPPPPADAAPMPAATRVETAPAAVPAPTAPQTMGRAPVPPPPGGEAADAAD